MAIWNAQISRNIAEQDGLMPDDFNWQLFPVFDAKLSLAHRDDRRWSLLYAAEMLGSTPHLNQYDEDGNKLPEPRGSALAWVKFSLIDTADGAVLHEDHRDHVEGAVRGGLTEGGERLWSRLGKGAIKVRLEATAFFFPYHDPDKGDGGLQYSAFPHGYLESETCRSKVYDLALTEQRELRLDGQPPPVIEHPETDEEREHREAHDRLMREEREAHEKREREIKEQAARENREANERIERERKEAEEADRKAREQAEAERKRHDEEMEQEKRRAEAERRRLGIPASKPATVDLSGKSDEYMAIHSYYDSQIRGSVNEDVMINAFLKRVRSTQTGEAWTTAIADFCADHGVEFDE